MGRSPCASTTTLAPARRGPRLRTRHAARGIYYAAFTLSGCVVEVFGDATRRIERTGRSVARPRLLRDLRLLGLDALVTVRGEAVPVPIDVTTRGRTNRAYIANLLDTLRRGVVPVVIERMPTDLAPDAAFAAFEFWWRRSEEYFSARGRLDAAGGFGCASGR